MTISCNTVIIHNNACDKIKHITTSIAIPCKTTNKKTAAITAILRTGSRDQMRSRAKELFRRCQGSNQSDAIYKRRARDPNNRMFLRVLNARLNVNLDDYDFPVIFVTSVCHQTIAPRYQRLLILQRVKTDQHNYSQCKNSSCQSLTRVVWWQLVRSSYYRKHRVACTTCW